MPIASLLHLLIVGWLPGAVIFRLPIAQRDKRAALDADERVFWAVLLSVAVSTSVVVLLAAIDRYTFERLLAADIAIAAGAGLAARFRLRLGTAATGLRPAAIVTVALIAMALYRFFPPAEYVIGGKDPGIYVSEGIQIAQRGTFIYRDPVVASVPPSARDLFLPSHQRDDYYSLRFMGFWIKNPDTGAVIGQFAHLFPASIAIGYGLDGLTGARRAIGVWAILGLLAVYFCGRRLFGGTAAAAAALLLCLHLLEVWFSRYPNAELVMQALLFAALLASARAHADNDEFFAPVAGTLLGLLLFVRFDAVLAIGAVLAALALARFAGVVRLRPGFFAPLVVGIGLAVPYWLGPMRAYMWQPLVFFNNLRTWQYAALAAGGLIVLALFVLGARHPRLSARVRTGAPTAIAAIVIAAALYALYLRQPIDRVLAAHDAFALRTFTSYYFTLPALLAALLGFALFARRDFWRAPELFTTLACFALFFFYKIRIVPEHFWMARRFLPVVLPGALLFVAAAALGGTRGSWAPTRLVRAAIGLVFVTLLAMHYARAARPVLAHVEYAGIIAKLEDIAGRVGDRDLLIVETRLPGSDTHILAMPLAYIYARNVLVFSTPKPDKDAFARFLDWARTRYERVLFMGGGGTDLVSSAWDAHPIASERFAIPEYEASTDHLPSYARTKEFDYSIYELTPPGDAPIGSIDLDVGTNDDLYLVRFHAKEQTEGRSIRWTRDRSLIAARALPPTAHEVVLTMSDGGRPAAAPKAVVTATLDGEQLGSVAVDTGFKDYRLQIPPTLVQRLTASGRGVELTLSTTTWNPEKVLGTPDPRDLGVMLDRVTIR